MAIQEGSAVDSQPFNDVRVEENVGQISSEESPLLPTCQIADGEQARALKRRITLICIVFLFTIEVAGDIMASPLQQIMEAIICHAHDESFASGELQMENPTCKDDDTQRTLAMISGWSSALQTAARKEPTH